MAGDHSNRSLVLLSP